MPDVTRDISLLVQIARLDASLSDDAVELAHLPARIQVVEKRIGACDEDEARLVGSFEDMKKERRALEQKLQDDEARVAKFKSDLMSVKSNREYAAAQKEIAHKEEDISREEERLLELMDSIESRESTLAKEVGDITTRRDTALAEKKTLEERRDFLQGEVERLQAEKPKLLSEVDKILERLYQRLMGKYGDVAATRVEGETCGGCHTQLPPQLVVEVRKNNQIITCQSCGRILVHYAD